MGTPLGRVSEHTWVSVSIRSLWPKPQEILKSQMQMAWAGGGGGHSNQVIVPLPWCEGSDEAFTLTPRPGLCTRVRGGGELGGSGANHPNAEVLYSPYQEEKLPCTWTAGFSPIHVCVCGGQ